MNNLLSVFKTFLALGLTSFGGPVAHIGYFRKEFVENKKWLDEKHFSQLLALCQFLPGPASSQLGFAIGMHRAGLLGGIAAFIAFTGPSVLLLMLFATAIVEISGSVFDAAIHGLKLVACAVVADAVIGMWKNLCQGLARKVIAALACAAFILLAGTWLQLAVILIGGFIGYMLQLTKEPANTEALKLGYGKKTGGLLLVSFTTLFVLLPFIANGYGSNDYLSSEYGLLAVANNFYQAGSLVFGGGHVVLPLLESSVVDTGWLNSQAFLAGYGASQAIPGPMFSFAAYLGMLAPSEASSITTSLVAVLFIFLPGFLLLLAILPFWQTLSNKPQMSSAVAGINAAVVGLLAATLYDPIATTGLTNTLDIMIVIIGLSLLRVWQLSPIYTVVWCLTASIIAGLF